MSPSTKINQAQAQLLMSQLMDGELSAPDAELLQNYLEAHPQEIDWMESLEIARSSPQSEVSPELREEALSRISASIAPKPTGKNLIPFPQVWKTLAAAAAVALVGAISWMGFHSSAPSAPEAPVVEFVATDLPDASTYIYTDEESGWTVVWVDSAAAPNGADKG